MGHEVVFIDRKSNPTPSWRFTLYIVRQALLRTIGRSDVDIRTAIRKFRDLETDRETVSKNTRKFIDEHIQPQTEEFTSSRSLEKGIKGYDLNALVVGSDQVWRSQYANIEDYFLGFAQGLNLKKISYAASFGTAQWMLDEVRTERCADLLKLFDAVSVREDSGVEMCRELFGVEAEQVLDPTMLLDAADYCKLLDDKHQSSQMAKPLLVYILSQTDDKERAASLVSERFDLPRLRVNNPKTEDRSLPADQRIAPPTDSWLNGFCSADRVFTDSFHGCVFSILFKRPFWAYIDEERGSTRLRSLLKLFELESRLVTSSTELTEARLSEPIDWDRVHAKLASEREESLNFLKYSLT